MQRNPLIPFTYVYSQPQEYHFSIDSIEAPFEIAQYYKDRNEPMKDWKIADLCAGCGVMGFELNFHLPEINQIDFVEVQSVYQKHFSANRDHVKNPGNFNFLNFNYESLLTEEYLNKYRLIICNPPYFQVGQGKLSPSEFKNRCRFFIDSTFAKLIEVIEHTLATDGEAFVLIRSLEQHGINFLKEIERLTNSRLVSEKFSDIRGTDLIKITKRS